VVKKWGGLPVPTEADDDQTLLLGHDGLVDVPACDEVGEDDRAHFWGVGRV
jgi:hypothetical protein